MKKLLLITGLLILSELAFSQVLIDTDKIWNVVECVSADDCWTESNKFGGDTMFEGITYRKLMRCNDSTLSDWNYSSALREDSTGKVFLYQGPNLGEALLYDFNLNAEDVFVTQINGNNIELFVESVDTVTLLNGEERKRIKFDTWEDEEWIIGIGSTFGILNVAYPHYLADIMFFLNCFTENDILKFDNPEFESCYYTYVGVNERLKTNQFVIQPNPFKNNFTIEFENDPNKYYELRIINSHGLLVNSIKKIYSGEIINAGDYLTKGLYFIQLFEDEKMISTDKIIKH